MYIFQVLSLQNIRMVMFLDFNFSTAGQEANKIPTLHLHPSTTVLKRKRGLSPQDTCSSACDGNGIKYSAIAQVGIEKSLLITPSS